MSNFPQEYRQYREGGGISSSKAYAQHKKDFTKLISAETSINVKRGRS